VPVPVDLSRLIPGHVTMQRKDTHDDVAVIMGLPPGGSILQSGAFGSVGWLTKDSTPAERLNMALKFGRPGGNRSRVSAVVMSHSDNSTAEGGSPDAQIPDHTGAGRCPGQGWVPASAGKGEERDASLNRPNEAEH
jgi:hypothetical protein